MSIMEIIRFKQYKKYVDSYLEQTLSEKEYRAYYEKYGKRLKLYL